MRIGLWIVLIKIASKVFPVILKLISAKFALAAISMVSYSLVFSWKFALIIMVMLFVHENGHIWAMRRFGMKTKGIYFLPFIGAAAVSDEEFPSAEAEAIVGIMGPIWGFGLASLAGLLYVVDPNPLFATVSAWMALINLFNLLPINPLDGGRVMKSIAFSVNSKLGLFLMLGGLVACIILAIYLNTLIFVALLVIGIYEFYIAWKHKKTPLKMSGPSTFLVFCLYVLVAGGLLMLMLNMQHVPGADLAMEFLRD